MVGLKEWHAATVRSLREQNACSELAAMGAQLLRQQISDGSFYERGKLSSSLDHLMQQSFPDFTLVPGSAGMHSDASC